ncbi:MAG: hypothetical protein LBI17_02725 [Rickettsiales bacterium]|jgi:hypothetical protein|nr:hypothetical protein [Rickettsiales bacterium]
MRFSKLLCILALAACVDGMEGVYPNMEPSAVSGGRVFSAVPVYERKPVRTFEDVEKFNLETPMRCTVDWSDQRLISALPFKRRDFYLERVDRGDVLPDLKVDNLSFEDKPVDEILGSLLRNTGVQVYATDDFYKKLTQEDIGGDLAKVVDLISSMGNVYYSYDDRMKRLTLRRYAKWNLHVPLSDDVILAMEDALRGADIDDIVVDWEDRVLIFQGDVVTEEKVRYIVGKFAIENYLVVSDIDVYRVYPNAGGSIPWENIISAFNRGSVKLSQKGIIGRAIVVGPNFNADSLKEFLAPHSGVVLVSSGKFVTPDRWQGRFDIGRCGREVKIETDLSVLTESRFTPKDDRQVGRLDTTLVLRTGQGDISKYTVPSRLGDNLLVIGIPTQYFVEGATAPVPPNAELVVLISPRIIKIVRPMEK